MLLGLCNHIMYNILHIGVFSMHLKFLKCLQTPWSNCCIFVFFSRFIWQKCSHQSYVLNIAFACHPACTLSCCCFVWSCSSSFPSPFATVGSWRTGRLVPDQMCVLFLFGLDLLSWNGTWIQNHSDYKSSVLVVMVLWPVFFSSELRALVVVSVAPL